MNKYSYNWRDSMRLRAGLLWKSEYPTPYDYPSMGRCMVYMLVVGFLWACAMTMDYADEANHQEAIAEKRANQLGECIQGKARFVTSDGYAIICRKAEQFKI